MRLADCLSQRSRAPSSSSTLKVTVSSPTLAQGLNLTATTLVMFSLHRHRNRIEVSEFRNVVGRAGRAYVDVEGMVLFPMFDEIGKRRYHWETLINEVGAREMESGLVKLVGTLIDRMHARIGGDLGHLIEYVLNNAEAWAFPDVATSHSEDLKHARAQWDRHIAWLDTAILSLIGDDDIPEEEVEAALDDVLRSSYGNGGYFAKRSRGSRLYEPAWFRAAGSFGRNLLRHNGEAIFSPASD